MKRTALTHRLSPIANSLIPIAYRLLPMACACAALALLFCASFQMDRPYRMSSAKFGWGAGIVYTYAKRSIAGVDNLGDIFLSRCFFKLEHNNMAKHSRFFFIISHRRPDS